MKRILFWIFCIITIALAVRIAKILIMDLDRLTQFGYGYLTAQVILFCFCLTASVMIGLKLFRPNRKTKLDRP